MVKITHFFIGQGLINNCARHHAQPWYELHRVLWLLALLASNDHGVVGDCVRCRALPLHRFEEHQRPPWLLAASRTLIKVL